MTVPGPDRIRRGPSIWMPGQESPGVPAAPSRPVERYAPASADLEERIDRIRQVHLSPAHEKCMEERLQSLESIARDRDPVRRNVRVTQAYYELSQEMRSTVGSQAGASWATWAVWASKHVGQTIRGEDIRFAKAGAGVALAVAAGVVGGPLAALGGYVAGRTAAAAQLHGISDAMARGNRNIFERTAPHFARFIETFRNDTMPDREKYLAFEEGFEPGPAEEGGEDLLKAAFHSYYRAKFESDPKIKQELMYLGNCQVVYDEQITAHQDIRDAMPFGARRLATQFLLKLPLPNETLNLGQDVPPLDGRSFPKTLQTLEHDELEAMLIGPDGLDRNPDGLQGSGATEWTNLEDRMNYIVKVFRSRHDEASLFEAPYTFQQQQQIHHGQIPTGAL